MEVGIGLASIEADAGAIDAVVPDLTLGLLELVERHGKPEVAEVQPDQFEDFDEPADEVDKPADGGDEDLLAQRVLDVEDHEFAWVPDVSLGALGLLPRVLLLDVHEDRHEQDMDGGTGAEQYPGEAATFGLSG